MFNRNKLNSIKRELAPEQFYMTQRMNYLNNKNTLIRLLNRAFRDNSLSVGIADIKLCLTGVSIII